MSSLSQSSIEKSINYWSTKHFEEYKEWLNKSLLLNDKPTIFYNQHLKNFLSLYSSKLGFEANLFRDKYFYTCLELKQYEECAIAVNALYKDFGSDKKIIKMLVEKNEIDPKGEVDLTLRKYKELMLVNQEDRDSIKRYIIFLKCDFTNDWKTYIDMWNEYLTVYMDDVDAWLELADVYWSCNNYTKAIYCLEEVLLHNPNDYKILCQIGDIYASLSNSESCNNAIKYYSQSIVIVPTPRALWGLIQCLSIIYKVDKKLSDKAKALLMIAKGHIKNLYLNTAFKVDLKDFYDFGEYDMI